MIKTDVFIKHKILSVHTILSAHMHTHTQTPARTSIPTIQNLIYTQMGSKQRLETWRQQHCQNQTAVLLFWGKDHYGETALVSSTVSSEGSAVPAEPSSTCQRQTVFKHFTSFPVRSTLSTDLCASWWGSALCRGRPRIHQWRCRWSRTWGSCGPAAGCETGARAAAKERLENHKPQHHCRKREEFKTKASYMTL